MKKIVVIALSVLVSACACFDCEDENGRPVTYQVSSKDQKLDCDYFDGKTCYRYVYKNTQRQVAKPEPVRYRPCGAPVVQPAQPAPCGCQQRHVEHVVPAPAPVVPQVKDDCCKDKVSETREPVEMVYKKVTTRTTYEPKTTSQVTYEKVPYTNTTTTTTEVQKAQTIEVVNPSTTTTTTVIEEVK